MKQTKFVLLAISLFALTLNLQVSAQDNVTCGEDVTYQGETYETIQIGKQCWFKKNLNVGTMINVQKGQTKNDTIEKYCYNNDPANCKLYGCLYRWNEAMQYTQFR
jgi:spore coat protein U-like protein